MTDGGDKKEVEGGNRNEVIKRRWIKGRWIKGRWTKGGWIKGRWTKGGDKKGMRLRETHPPMFMVV